MKETGERPARQVLRRSRAAETGRHVLVAEEAVQLDDEVVLVGGEVAALEVGAEVVDPAEAAALAAAHQSSRLGQRPPAPFAVRADVRHQAVVLLLGPRALVRVRLLAARRPPHRPASCLAFRFRFGYRFAVWSGGRRLRRAGRGASSAIGLENGSGWAGARGFYRRVVGKRREMRRRGWGRKGSWWVGSVGLGCVGVS